MIYDHSDFRGGYFTDLPTDLMKDTELLTAQNCYWRDGLKKRLGKASVVSLTGSDIRGGYRAKIEGNWYTFLAVDTTAAGAVEFKYGTATSFSSLAMPSGTAFTFGTGYDVQFAVLDDKIIAVNGNDKPAVLWASASTFQVDTIERQDTRLMDTGDWNAGQYYPSLTSTMYFTDTTDAQSSASADFLLATYSVTSGFWIACAHTFNKATLYDVKANATGSMTFEYYGRASSGAATGWVSFTPISTPTWTAAGDKIIEMDFPIDTNTKEILMEPTPSLNASIGGVYAMRFQNANTIDSVTSWAAARLKVEHTQYLTQILLNDRPDTVAVHKSHAILGLGNWMHISPYAQLTGWRESDKQYFAEGGYIQQMVSHQDYLAILLDNSLWALQGNSWQNWSVQLLRDKKGAFGKRSAALVNDEIYFQARDGIYGWNGSRLLKLSKHIKTDFDSLSTVNAAAANVNGEYWISFPESSTTLLFDPDTLRVDDVGDGRMSFYKFTGYQVDQFLPYTGGGDTGAYMAIANGSNKRLDQLETANYDKIGASATIAYTVRTNDNDYEDSNRLKIFRRMKYQAQQVSATGGQAITIKHHAYGPGGSITSSVAVNLTVGSDVFSGYLGVPPGIEGYNYGIEITHQSQYDFKFLGYSVDVEKRSY